RARTRAARHWSLSRWTRPSRVRRWPRSRRRSTPSRCVPPTSS
ncbi:MAG: hypothetical protein AVDCRST_MAG60-285, partial [uncultured Nocardioides sp.]